MQQKQPNELVRVPPAGSQVAIVDVKLPELVGELPGCDTHLPAELSERDRRRLLAENDLTRPLDPRFFFRNRLSRMLSRMI